VHKACVCIIVLLAILLAVTVPHEVLGTPSRVNRVFYLSSPTSGSPVTPSNPGTVSSTPPIGTCPTCTANITTTPIGFALPIPVIGMTVQGPAKMSLSIKYRFNQTVNPVLQAAFSYRFPGVSTWTNTNTTQQIPFLSNNVTFDLPVLSTQLVEESSVAVELSVTSVPKNGTISLSWGSSSSRSFVSIPMSGYENVYPADTVTIQDTNQNRSPFYLNAPNNILVVKVTVQSAFGFTDIQKVNMTILDPHSQPVSKATNETMQGPSTGPCPCSFVGVWQYPNNSTQGQYSVMINIIDIQGNIAYASPPSASTFLLYPAGYVPFPYNLIPYLIVASVVASGGIGSVALYRRKRRKSYLVPFDYFNTLTGGGLNGGTSVTVEGNTGSGKTLLFEQLMGDDLRNGRPCVFVSTGEFPDTIRATMKTMGVDVSGYEQNGLLTFVDGYSAEAGRESREKVSVPSLGDLTTLGIKISSAFPSPSFKGGSLYFDSLTPLASKAKPESIVSLVQSIGAKVKGLSGKAFFAIGLGIDYNVQRQLEDSADCIVQMEAFEESGNRRRRLRIAKLRARKHQEGWVLFTIEDGKGIIFYSKSPRQ
jgi:KaiC/GvpD/RAD55 family RecA-like ATPase